MPYFHEFVKKKDPEARTSYLGSFLENNLKVEIKTQISGSFCVSYTIYHEVKSFEMVFADRIL